MRTAADPARKVFEMLRRALRMLGRAKTVVPDPGKEHADVLSRIKFPCC